MQQYSEQYQRMKSPRRLTWRPALGAVDIELTVGEVTVDFKVTPLHAVLLTEFKNSASMTAGQLAAGVRCCLFVLAVEFTGCTTFQDTKKLTCWFILRGPYFHC